MVAVMHDQGTDLLMTGSFEDYLAAVKALRSLVIFIETLELTEEDFIYAGEDDDNFGEDEDVEEIDLREVEPKLRNFLSRMGETGWVQLAAPMANGSLTYIIEEGWWTQLYDLIDAANESVHENRSAAQEQKDAEEEQQKNVTRNRLQSLINDADFQRLKTQKAMREYAVEKYPELMEWDNIEIKGEIQNLAARIEAKGLGRK